jgi:hypothetical protein
MSNRYARILAAGGAAVLVAALGIPAALAALPAKTWTVRPGGAITAMSGRFTFTDTGTGATVACASSTASGKLKTGSGLAGTGVGKITSVIFNGTGAGGACVSPGGPSRRALFALQAGGLPWHVNFSSYSAAKGATGGTISHIHVALSGSGCTAMIDGMSGTADDGQVKFRYTDSTGQLKVRAAGGNLHVYDVGPGCLGLVRDGDAATLSATYTVTPEQAITSP